MKIEAVALLLSDARGQYIPRDFVQGFDLSKWTGISDYAAETCSNPEADGYWDAWEDILDNATHTDADGNVFRLMQNGDLWAYCVERMTIEEQANLFECSSICDSHVPDGFELFIISQQFVTCLHYGDRDHLTDDDEAMLDNFIVENGDDIRDSHDFGFDRCEITDLMGDCSLVLLKCKE